MEAPDISLAYPNEKMLAYWRTKREYIWACMPVFESLASRSSSSVETIRNVLGSLIGRYPREEVFTAVHQVPAREAKFRSMPEWLTSTLVEAYRSKGILELYSHQAASADLVQKGKSFVVVTPTASGSQLRRASGLNCLSRPILRSNKKSRSLC